MTSIFIKTYPNDHTWLQYLLPSIEKYAEGFKDVVIVSDAGTVVPPEYLSFIKKIPVKTHYIKVPPMTNQYPKNIDVGIGYLWQQCIKLNWHNLCDSASALFLDSDEMLCKRLTPEQLKRDGKWVWTYRPWKEAGPAQCWKQSTDYILGKNTPYEAMVTPGFVMTRTATTNLLNYIYQNHSISNFWELVTKKKMNKFSEYNIYGSFIHGVNDSDYFYDVLIGKKYDTSCMIMPEHMIKNWSWGKITPEIHRKAMAHLT